MELKRTGKVYLVGAGPSDIGLLTLKALQVLKKADTVIYDALIGPSIRTLFPHGAEKICVGKRAGRHSIKQEEINRLIADKALKGRIVVRLKGGDPFLFGRGGEEVQTLLAHRIPYEIVPGVPSAVSVPAYAGIPVTYRGMASGVHILTGHKKQDEPLELDFEALVRSGGTYVFLMGMSALHEIVSGFLNAGMAPDMPAAVIEQGTGARQRTAAAPLSALEEEVRNRQLCAPAVIVIGKTAALGKEFGWYEKLPLFGSRILVTRPASRSRKLSDMLRALGAEVIEMPAIHTQKRDCARELLDALSQIGDYQYLVFTSPAGVDYFFELLERMELDIRCIGRIKLAVIGPATKSALRKRGLKTELMPERYNGEALAKLLGKSLKDGEKVLILRSAMGSEELVKEIQSEKNIQVTSLAVYDTVYTADLDTAADDADSRTEEESWMECGRADMVMFTSASTVRGFVQMTKGLDYTKIQAVCIGRMTADQAAFYGMQVYQARQETIESMTEAALQLHKKTENK